MLMSNRKVEQRLVRREEKNGCSFNQWFDSSSRRIFRLILSKNTCLLFKMSDLSSTTLSDEYLNEQLINCLNVQTNVIENLAQYSQYISLQLIEIKVCCHFTSAQHHQGQLLLFRIM